MQITPGPHQNTDRELWRKDKEDTYSPSIHVTQSGRIGINVGGTVITRSVEEWHRLATNGGWINARTSPPLEGGRYWCVISEVNDLGTSHYQWNCEFNEMESIWRDEKSKVNVVYWMPLMPYPFLIGI